MTTINGGKVGSILDSLFNSSTSGHHIGLVAAGLAGLNGAATITSVLSGAYGDYEKEGRTAMLFYTIEGYTAIGYSLASFFLLGGEEYTSAVAFGNLPLLLFLLRLISTRRFWNFPDERERNKSCFAVLVLCLLLSSLLSGRGNPKFFLQVVSTLGIIRSVRRVLSPESVLEKYKFLKYKWDQQSGEWTKISNGKDIEHRGEPTCYTVCIIIIYMRQMYPLL